MASYWIPHLLALEVSTTTRQAQGASRSSAADPRDDPGNPLWGAPRIHGELLKLGIAVGQTSVAKYMARHRRPPSQGWRTFLLNHVDRPNGLVTCGTASNCELGSDPARPSCRTSFAG